MRQAEKAAEAAKEAAAAVLASGHASKRADRSKHGRKSHLRGDGRSATTDSTTAENTKGRGKKKKRSALANASNPHHLRNYIPSRLPNSQSAASLAVTNAQNLLSPFPMRFLSAEIPPRRRKQSERTVAPTSTLTNPADEWICPFCEYSLFYGEDHSYKRAVENRKKILRRRRRARERAAAAASGVAAVKTAERTTAANEDVNAGFETPIHADVVPTGDKQAHKWKDDREEVSVAGVGGPTQAALG